LCFALLSSITHSSQTDWRSARVEQLTLPLFFNPSPVDLNTRVNSLIAQLRHRNDVSAVIELRRLGGAAFPVLIPRIETLPREVQLRIAEALIPVLRRMGWRGASDMASPELALRFLEDTWQERAADFNQNIVTRWVQRLALRPNLELYETVVEYDTYALPALIAALPRIETERDVERAVRLTNVASRISGQNLIVSKNESLARARLIVERWRSWWQLHHSEYTVLSGPSRWSAMLGETLFGQWLTIAITFAFGTTRNDTPIIGALLPASYNTLILLFTTSLGTWLVTYIPNSLRRHRPRRELSTLVDALGQALFAIPTISLVAVLMNVFPKQWTLVSAALTAVFATAVADWASHLSAPHVPQTIFINPETHLPAERRSRSPVFRLLRQWQFAGHGWPFSLLLVFVTEKAFAILGLSHLTVASFRQHDLNMLMAITTTTATWVLFVEFAVQLRRKKQNPPNTPHLDRL
jgi:hypothetical protein